MQIHFDRSLIYDYCSVSKVKMNGDRLESKKKEVLMVAAEAEQLRTELMKVTATGDRVEMEQKECDVVLCSDQQRHSEEIKKIDDAVLNFEAEFDVVRENSMKLVSVGVLRLLSCLRWLEVHRFRILNMEFYSFR